MKDNRIFAVLCVMYEGINNQIAKVKKGEIFSDLQILKTGSSNFRSKSSVFREIRREPQKWSKVLRINALPCMRR